MEHESLPLLQTLAVLGIAGVGLAFAVLLPFGIVIAWDNLKTRTWRRTLVKNPPVRYIR